jgi:hypothetical protein
MLMDSKHGDLRGLSYLLRNRNMWPEGFEWDYSVCAKCAMGLARKAGLENFNKELDHTTNVYLFMNMTDATSSTTTPEIVADRIDGYLETV